MTTPQTTATVLVGMALGAAAVLGAQAVGVEPHTAAGAVTAWAAAELGVPALTAAEMIEALEQLRAGGAA